MFNIFISSSDVENMVSTIHHELSHVIDNALVLMQKDEENPVFSEEKWNELNPYADMYLYSYHEDRNEYYKEYLYEIDFGISDNYTNAYFVDSYALTYPTEDRARIFERLLGNEDKTIDYSKTPNLKKKLNYYAECIRATFDTTGWKNVPWEAYME